MNRRQPAVPHLFMKSARVAAHWPVWSRAPLLRGWALGAVWRAARLPAASNGSHGVSSAVDRFHCAALNLRLRPVIELLRAGHFGRQQDTAKFCPFAPALFQS